MQTVRMVNRLKKVVIGALMALLTVGVGQAAEQTPDAFQDFTGPIQQIVDLISGPVAQMLGVIVIVIAGLGIAFGEGGSGVRKLFQIVFGLGIAFTAGSLVANLFGASSGVAF